MRVDPLKLANLKECLKTANFLCSEGMGIQFRTKGVARSVVEYSIDLADSCLAVHGKDPDWNIRVKSVVKLYREALTYRKGAALANGMFATKMKKSLRLAESLLQALQNEGIILN